MKFTVEGSFIIDSVPYWKRIEIEANNFGHAEKEAIFLYPQFEIYCISKD